MKFRSTLRGTVCACILTMTAYVNGATSSSATWEGRYEADALPTDAGWVAKFSGADNYARIENGTIVIDTIGSDQFPYWLSELNLDVTRGVTVEWKVRIRETEAGDIPSATVLGVRASGAGTVYDMVAMAIGEMAVHCQGVVVKMDTADRFHTYRLTLQPSGYNFYIDHNPTPVASGPLPVLENKSNTDQGIQFGDHSPVPDAAYEIDYIRWTATGAFVPDAHSASADEVANEQAFDDAGLTRLADEGNLIIGVPIAQQSPVTDGIVNEGEYAFAGLGFHDVVSGNFAAHQSRYYISYDNRALYVAIQSPRLDELKSKINRRDDSTVCLDDAAEIFIVPDTGVSPVYQIIVNSIGTLFDQKDSDAAWNVKHSRFRNKVEGDTWTMEAVIPFADLGVSAPKPGDIWRINLCRSYAGSAPLYTGMSPTRHSYLSPRRFAYVRFMEAGPQLKMVSLGDLSEGKLDFSIAGVGDDVSAGGVNIDVTNQVDGERTTLLSQPLTDQSNLANDALGDGGVVAIRSTSEQLGLLYAGEFSYARNKENFRQNYIYTNLQERALKLGVHVPLRYLAGGGVDGVVRLHRQGEPVIDQTFHATAADIEVSIDISNLPEGDYTTEVVFERGSDEPVRLENSYHRYADGPSPWDGNHAGIIEGVPAPWTDMVRQDDAVSIWDRTYHFDNGLLLSQIDSRDRQVLTAPMAVAAVINGQAQTPQQVKSEWSKETSTVAERTASAALGSVQVQSAIRVEYDGFTWVTLKLHSDVPVKLDELYIDIPLDKKYVTLRNLGDYRMERSGAIPDGSFAKDLRERPIFWLGDETGGLQWFAESMPGWHLADWSRSLEVINEPGANQIVARLNVIDSTVELNGTREIAFGMIATPVKPARKDFREWRIAPSGSTAAYNLYIWFTEWTKWVNYPDPSVVVEEKMDLLKAFHRNGVRVTPYLTLSIASPLSPEFKFYGDDWLMQPAKLIRDTTNPFDPQWDIWANYIVCNNSASYRDFFAQKMDTMLSQMEFDGIYFDFGTSRMCGNGLHGCGWVDNTGATQRSLNILGTRDIARRAYNIIHQYATPNPLIVHHMSGEVDMATNAYCDIMLTGENMTGALMVNESYYNALPLDKFRSEFISQPWGPMVMNIPQFERAMHVASPDRVAFYSTPEGQKPLDHLIGMTVVHDGLVWPSDGIKPDRLWEVQDALIWDEKVEFFPYWDNAQYITVNSPGSADVVVSIYRRDNWLVVVPFNNTDEPITFNATVNLDALGFGGAKPEMVDHYYRENFVHQNGQIEVPVGARSFRMMFIGKK